MSFYGRVREDARSAGARRYHPNSAKMAGVYAVTQVLSVAEELREAEATEDRRLRAEILDAMPEVAASLRAHSSEAPLPGGIPISDAGATRSVTAADRGATLRLPSLLQSVLVISAAAIVGSLLLGLVIAWFLSAIDDLSNSHMMGPIGLVVVAVLFVIALVLWCVALVPPAVIAACVNGRFIDGMIAAAGASQITLIVFLILSGSLFRDASTTFVILAGSFLWSLALSFPAAAAGHGISVLLRHRRTRPLVSATESGHGDAAEPAVTAAAAVVPPVRKRSRRPSAPTPTGKRRAVYCDECGASNVPGRARCLMCNAWLHDRA